MWLAGANRSVARPERGETILVALPYEGLTPHRWTLRPTPSAVVAGRRRVAASSGGVGAGGHEEIQVEIRGVADTLVFDLVAPRGVPVMTRRLSFT